MFLIYFYSVYKTMYATEKLVNLLTFINRNIIPVST